MPPRVRSFTENEWSVYRDLRLSALAESPDAFGSTYANEAQRPNAEWASRIAAGVRSPWDLPVLAELDDQPIGLAWGRIEESNPMVANLYQVWVHPDYRHLGTGRMLLMEILSWAKRKHAEELELAVTCGDTPAKRLYARAGFEPVGQPRPLREGADVLVQPMRLSLQEVAIDDAATLPQ